MPVLKQQHAHAAAMLAAAADAMADAAAKLATKFSVTAVRRAGPRAPLPPTAYP
jgi:hypothetical protein